MQRLRRFLDRISNGLVLGILALFGIAAIGASVYAHIVSGQDWYEWWDSLAQNFGAGMIGALVTFLLIDRIIARRELKSRLIREMRSDVRDIAVPAAEELRARGWLTDGSLEGAYLTRANLQGAELTEAKLQKAWLVAANLQEADLTNANLEGANLRLARLQGADLMDTNLERANLESADLERAILWQANLKGTDMEYANLKGADLPADAGGFDAGFNEHTVLPDGSEWRHGTDLARFIDPDHPNFWRSDYLPSPAYKGKKSEEM